MTSSQNIIDVINYYYENYTDEYGQKYIELVIVNLSMFKKSGLIHLLQKYSINYELIFKEMKQKKLREIEKQRKYSYTILLRVEIVVR